MTKLTEILATPESVTPERVTSVRFEAIGVGLLGDTLRLHLIYYGVAMAHRGRTCANCSQSIRTHAKAPRRSGFGACYPIGDDLRRDYRRGAAWSLPPLLVSAVSKCTSRSDAMFLHMGRGSAVQMLEHDMLSLA